MSPKSSEGINQANWLVRICSLNWLSQSYCYTSLAVVKLALRKKRNQRAERLVVGTLAALCQAFRPQHGFQELQVQTH